jgi:hypothetical protein
MPISRAITLSGAPAPAIILGELKEANLGELKEAKKLT